MTGGVLRNLCWQAAVLAAIGVGQAAAEEASYELRSKRAAGEVSRVEAAIQVGGDLKLVDGEQVRKLPLDVEARMDYGEKLLSDVPDDAQSLRSVRYYQRADATLQIDKDELKPALDDARRLIGVSAGEGRPLVVSLAGPLTRDELDLIDVQGNSLLIEALLPGEPVKVGDSWEHDPQLVAALLGLDAASQSDARSELKEVNGSIAQLELTGRVQGAYQGVASEVEVKGRYQFDLDKRRVTWFAMLMKENRSIGHVAAGVDVVAKVQMRITPGAVAPELSDDALAGIPLDANPGLAMLAYESNLGRFRLLHDRRWHVMADQPTDVVLRLVDRGELVAQCTVSSLPPVKPGEHASLADFQADIQKSLGENFGQFVNAAETSDAQGRIVYRVIAAGKVSDLPIQWNYYLVADPNGRQVVLGFTMEGALVERFGAADNEMVALVEMLDPPVDTAAQPTPAAK